MSNYLSQELAVVATVDPGALLDNTTATSDWVDISKFNKVMFVVAVGATDTTVDAIIQEADDSSGTNPATVSGKSITQLTGANGDNKQVILEANASEISSGKTHIACKVTVGDGTSGAYVTVIGLGGCARYNPASNNDLASVVEIIA